MTEDDVRRIVREELAKSGSWRDLRFGPQAVPPGYVPPPFGVCTFCFKVEHGWLPEDLKRGRRTLNGVIEYHCHAAAD